jgi:hypothetical protein
MPPEGEQKIFDEFVARTAKERDAEYTQVFSQLGLGAEAIDAFKQKLIEVHKKAISAGWPLSALAREKKDYDEELRSMLGEDKYARYRDYEETKPARRELQLIQSLEASNVSLNSEESDKVIQLIKASQAYTTERWDGPYDPLPAPTSGRAQERKRLSQSISELSYRSSMVVEGLREAAIPETFVDALNSHYSTKIAGMQARLAAMEQPMPIEEYARMLTREHAPQRKPAPSSGQ